MIEIKTKHPIAIESLDHLYPEGVHYDNASSNKFIQDVETYFRKNLNFMDLGCAGGALAVELHTRGYVSVGIDGSDKGYNINEEQLKHFNGQYPMGYTNWTNHLNKVLFTADVTKPYELIKDNEQLKFDLITCWDVMEHFEPNQVESFIKHMLYNLKDGGMFVASIALFPSGTHKEWEDNPDIQYHKSLFDREWWMNKLTPYFNVIPYPFSICNREYIPIDNSSQNYLLFTGIKK